MFMTLAQSWEVDNLHRWQLRDRISQRKGAGSERTWRETREDCEVAEGLWTES